ncbi:MAG: hypothetical protein IKZ99_04030 [Salinivirgaceae bacterium]|nr:hypothetical protein [Salinivirgaceae bacterium]
MKYTILFEGKTTMGGRDVNLKIYRVEDEKGKFSHYEWDYDPYLVDEDQADVHIGEINLGHTLEDILYKINMYKDDIHKIKAIKPNSHFNMES